MYSREEISRVCGVIGCDNPHEFAKLDVPPEVAEYLTSGSFSRITSFQICSQHWERLEEAVQSGDPSMVPRLDPKAGSFVIKGIYGMAVGESRPTKVEYWKQSILKEGREHRETGDMSIYDVLDEGGRVLNDANLSERLISLLVDETYLDYGPSESAKRNVIDEIDSFEGVTVKLTQGFRTDFVSLSEDVNACGDVLWLGEDVTCDHHPPAKCPIKSHERHLGWNEDLTASFDSADVIGYSNQYAEKALRILYFQFETHAYTGFIGVDNEESELFDQVRYKPTRTEVTAMMYGDKVVLPSIDAIPAFLSGDKTYEEIYTERVEEVVGSVSIPKKMGRYLQSLAL